MVLKTQRVPHQTEEAFDENDREEIHRIIADLRKTYVDRHTEAVAAFNKIQRESNRAQHEMHRIERHLERIDEFCNKNDIATASTVWNEK
jgi:hypothetical protein